MAKFRSINPKKKEFVFFSHGNSEDENPAKIIFKRFPFGQETFFSAGTEMFEGADFENIKTEEAQKVLGELAAKNIAKNMNKIKVDFNLFFDECVDHFEEFVYINPEGNAFKIITANDLVQITPPDFWEPIAREAYKYAMKKDEFTMGELKA
jgi:hypothetical protein